MHSCFNNDLEILGWPSSPVLNLALLWKLVRISWVHSATVNPTHSKASSPPHSKTAQVQVDSQPLLPLVTMWADWWLHMVVQRSHMEQAVLRACRSQNTEGLRRDFRCSACSQEAETTSDKVQSSGYLTQSTSQTRLCLGPLEFPLTCYFCTTPMQI